MCEVRERLDHDHPRLLEAPVKEFAVLAAETLNYGGRFSATTTANPAPELKVWLGDKIQAATSLLG